MYRLYIQINHTIPWASFGRKVKHYLWCLITRRKNIWDRLEERRIGNLSSQELLNELKNPYSLEAMWKIEDIWEKKNHRLWWRDFIES